MNLLEEVRSQFDISDSSRRAVMTRARSAPARDLRLMLDRAGLKEEADAVARKWMITDTGPNSLSLVV